MTHVASGKRYVGQSIDIDHRWREHAKGRTGSGVLAHAIRKYGWPAFAASILERCDRDELDAAEKRWIETLETLHPAGYNLTTGGQKYKFTDSARAHISERTRAVMTPEWCANRARSQRGIPKSADWCEQMSVRQKSPENVARITAMARNQSKETREKIAAAHRGKTLSAETRAKVSASKTGKKLPPQTPEDRAKKSIAAKARWARERVAKQTGVAA